MSKACLRTGRIERCQKKLLRKMKAETFRLKVSAKIDKPAYLNDTVYCTRPLVRFN
jgi:hypothetical protein